MRETVIIAFSTFTFGILVSAVFPHIRPAPETASGECRARYPLLAVSVDCGDSDAAANRMTMIKNEARRVAEQTKEIGRVNHVSAFFHDLDTRRRFEIDETAPVYQTSLAKLPIAMMTYGIAEVRPDILDMALPITEDGLAKDAGVLCRYRPVRGWEAGPGPGNSSVTCSSNPTTRQSIRSYPLRIFSGTTSSRISASIGPISAVREPGPGR